MPPRPTPAAGRRGRIALLSPGELRTCYADALAQARLLGELLRLAERVGRRRAAPVPVPVRLLRRPGAP